MISNSILAANPDIGKKLTELVNNKMCRFCLTETEDLFDIVEYGDKDEPTNTNWKLMLTTCFAVSSLISKNLFKYACKQCSEFVKKCYEFHKLRRKAEVLLLSYSLSGFWTQKLEVPEWLRPAKKRQPGDEMVVDSPTGKRFCFSEEKDSQAETEAVDNTKEKASDSEASLVGASHVPSHDSTTVQPTLQSPMITSGNARTTSVIQNVGSHQSGANAVQSKPLLDADKSAIPISVSIPCTRPENLDQSSSSNGLGHQLPKSATSNPTLRQKLEQLPSKDPNSLNQPSTLISSSVQTAQSAESSNQLSKQISTTQPESSPAENKSTLLYFRCSDCSFQFFNEQHLKLHMRKHSEEIQFRCHCDQEIRDWIPFLRHIEQRHLDLGWCYLCGDPFNNAAEKRSYRAWHLWQHLEVKLTHACDFCMLTFTTGAERIGHIGRVHGAEARVVGIEPV